MNEDSPTNVIILAAGSGSRMQGDVADKMLAPLNDLPVICYSVQAFLASGCIQGLTIVYRDEPQKTDLEAALRQIDLNGLAVHWVQGGQRRQDSVYKALSNQPKACSFVFIHDGARPLVTKEAIRKLHATALRDHAATLAHPVTDTIKRIPDAMELAKSPLEDLDRSRLWAVETPQAFAFDLILKAYEYVNREGLEITDDTAAISALGIGTTLVPNATVNIKITHPEDLDYAAWKLSER